MFKGFVFICKYVCVCARVCVCVCGGGGGGGGHMPTEFQAEMSPWKKQ